MRIVDEGPMDEGEDEILCRECRETLVRDLARHKDAGRCLEWFDHAVAQGMDPREALWRAMPEGGDDGDALSSED
jgi:hypothetical protein